MPSWDCIEDASSEPTRIWLEREKDGDEWKPLRKADCRALNLCKDEPVYIDGGRSIADPIKGVIRYNFFNGPLRKLTSATWFVREEKSSKEFVLLPMSALDSELVETLYQRAVSATSSLGEGGDSIFNEKYALQDESEYSAIVVKNGANVLTMRKKPKGWFGTSYDLQRGWGEYVVEGEADEMALGPVGLVIFAVHGVGEAMWTKDQFKTASLTQEMDRTRAMIHKKLVTEWKKECEVAHKKGEDTPPPPNRIEFLPIEWYDRIHSSSNSIMKSLKATTLKTIPAIRAIANDVVFDVLMYLTPAFCESVLDCVTTQINDLYHNFQKVHPGFAKNGGKFSLVGHSLGSVIVWDLLSILKEQSERKEKQPDSLDDDDKMTTQRNTCRTSAVGYQAYATTDENANAARNGTWGPSLPKPFSKCIPFTPEFTIFLGSPIGLFLTLRGAHAVFDEMRLLSVVDEKQKAKHSQQDDGSQGASKIQTQVPIVSPFSLPSGSIYNIFHPSDPIAYRIEPLLLPQDFDDADLPPPVYLVKEGEGVRLHVMAKQIGNGIRQSLFGSTKKNKSVTTLFGKVTEQAVAALVETADIMDDSEKRLRNVSSLHPKDIQFALGGKNTRVDFQLQPGVVDNEYISAVAAHSSYFSSNDVLEKIIDLGSGIHKNNSASSLKHQEGYENTK